MFKSILVILIFSMFSAGFSQSEIYELRVYHMAFGKPTDVFQDYMERALIPALNRQGIKHVGVFEESSEALPKKVYLLITYPSMQAHQDVADALVKDDQFNMDAKPYHTADPNQIPFERMESSLIRSVSGFPHLVKPENDSKLFELRIYESYNEDALRRKVKMFNESEFAIFKEVGLNTVFFGTNISGKQMPCLTYLLAFKDKAEQEQAWSKFGPHPEWQRINKLEEYNNAMNDITRVFLKPLAYSQL